MVTKQFLPQCFYTLMKSSATTYIIWQLCCRRKETFTSEAFTQNSGPTLGSSGGVNWWPKVRLCVEMDKERITLFTRVNDQRYQNVSVVFHSRIFHREIQVNSLLWSCTTWGDIFTATFFMRWRLIHLLVYTPSTVHHLLPWCYKTKKANCSRCKRIKHINCEFRFETDWLMNWKVKAQNCIPTLSRSKLLFTTSGAGLGHFVCRP